MKILFVVASSTWGGGEEYLYRLGTALRDRGYDISFALQNGSKEVLRERFSSLGETMLLRLKGNIFKLVPLISGWRLWRFAEKRGTDVIHVNARMDYYVAVWAKIFSHGKIKIVATNHLVKRAKSTPLRRWAYRRIDALIHVSECAKEEYLMIPEVRELFRRVYVIRNSVPDSVSSVERETKRDVRVLYHGRIHREKGILQLAEHWERAKAVLYIAGTGEAVPERKNVINLGFCPNVREMIGGYDICISPSVVRESGGPLSVIEAMAAGKPVITSDNGCQREYVRDGVDGILCEAGHWDEFVDAVNRLVTDDSLREEMGRNGRAHYESELSYDRFVSEIERVYAASDT